MNLVPMNELQAMANAVAESKLFGAKTPAEALALMLVAQSEGKHPATVARDYDIIQGKPAKKAEAMLRDFIEQGGKVEWHTLDDTIADATFAHPAGGTVRVAWDMKRATQAGLGGKDMWKKWPRQMLRSRTVSEGVRTVCPSATSGMYVPEEVRDFDQRPERDITPAKPRLAAPLPPSDDEKVAKLTAALQAAEMTEAWFLNGAGRSSLTEIKSVTRALAWIADPANAEPVATGETVDEFRAALDAEGLTK